jgi:DNA invertase Pin-like site-specific DNA recombinase
MAVTRVCLYTRISTDEETQPTSLHSQREHLEAFCTAQEGRRIVAHEEDRATGTKLDRPGLLVALDLARAGAIDMLLVYRVDRLSRKVRQLTQLAEELDTYDVTLSPQKPTRRPTAPTSKPSPTRSEILPTYRIVTPEVCTLPSSVGGTGLEPVTPSLSSWCSPN